MIVAIFYPPFIFSAIVASLLWSRVAYGSSFRAAFLGLFSQRIWMRKGTLEDGALCLVNLIILAGVVDTVHSSAFELGLESLPRLNLFQSSELLESLVATLISMLAFDFASYVMHRILHSSEFLWKCHSLHHSAEVLTPLTTFRQHPIEIILLNLARGFAAGASLAVFRMAFSSGAPLILIYDMGVGFFLYMFTVNLHHWMVTVKYPKWLRFLLISPHIHHLHHSNNPRHFDSNFGVIFSIWDRLFRTYLDEDCDPNEIQFGLAQKLPATTSSRGL